MRTRILLIILLFAGALSAQETDCKSSTLASSHCQTVSIVFGGDAMGHSPQFQAAYNSATHTYDYEPCFRYIRRYVQPADLAVVNLEVTLGGEPYSGYPNFSTPDSYFSALKDAGFDVMMLANNHILDRGKRGMERTLSVIGDFPNMGAYRDSTDRANRYPLVMDVKGVRVALFNCTYGCNGYSPIAPNMVNMIDTAQILNDLHSVEGRKIDLKVMCIHWGIEYQLHAVAAQEEMAHWFADHGFDLVIGGHPHVVENAELLGAMPVYYSLGNLVSNQRRENTNGGILVRVDIDKATKRIVSTAYLPCYVHKGSLTYRQGDRSVTERQYFLIPTTDYEEGRFPFRLSATDEAALKRFHSLTTTRLSNMTLWEE